MLRLLTRTRGRNLKAKWSNAKRYNYLCFPQSHEDREVRGKHVSSGGARPQRTPDRRQRHVFTRDDISSPQPLTAHGRGRPAGTRMHHTPRSSAALSTAPARVDYTRRSQNAERSLARSGEETRHCTFAERRPRRAQNGAHCVTRTTASARPAAGTGQLSAVCRRARGRRAARSMPRPTRARCRRRHRRSSATGRAAASRG